METITFNDVEIDRCLDCYGIWFDHLERSRLAGLKGAESIDIGDEETGARHDGMVYVECPRCFGIMERMEAGSSSSPIHYDLCVSCHGSYFDAGEFRRYLLSERS
jgi:Zn-finger nucleic acid-binding protein|tara:strand:- start:75 stop:389 length:315 start_codon:yes stop_codon:yes gene_type:complete